MGLAAAGQVGVAEGRVIFKRTHYPNLVNSPVP